MGLIPIGCDPTNQTTTIGNFPIGTNPIKILWYSFESKRPLVQLLMVHLTNSFDTFEWKLTTSGSFMVKSM